MKSFIPDMIRRNLVEVAAEAEAKVVCGDLVGMEIIVTEADDATSVSSVSRRITLLETVQMQPLKKYTLSKKLTLQFILHCI